MNSVLLDRVKRILAEEVEKGYLDSNIVEALVKMIDYDELTEIIGE